MVYPLVGIQVTSLDPRLCNLAKESKYFPQPVSVLPHANATVPSGPGPLQPTNSITTFSRVNATVPSSPTPSQFINSIAMFSHIDTTVPSSPGPSQPINSLTTFSHVDATVPSSPGPSQPINSLTIFSHVDATVPSSPSPSQVLSNEAFTEQPKKTTPGLATSLNALASVAAQLDIRLPPITSPDTTTLSTKTKLSDSGTTSNSGQANTMNITESALSKKIVKMCLEPMQNRRNLCAHQWLKVFKDTSNGTTAEFKVYYDRLSKEQRELYNKEAKDLVSKKAWNKDAFNGTIY